MGVFFMTTVGLLLPQGHRTLKDIWDLPRIRVLVSVGGRLGSAWGPWAGYSFLASWCVLLKVLSN